MKKLIFLALSLAAISIRAEQLEDVTIVINVRSSEPASSIGAQPLAAPVAYDNKSVVYNAPVVYTAPVVYNNVTVTPPAPVQTTPPPCATAYRRYDYSDCPSHPCHFLYNPDLIQFGQIQAAREGYYFSSPR